MMYSEVSEWEAEGESASETESVTHSDAEQLVDNSDKVTDLTQELLNESEENEQLPHCAEFDYDKDVEKIRKAESEKITKEQEMRKKQRGTNSTLLPFPSGEMGQLVLHDKLIACNTEEKNAALFSILETSGFAQIFGETDQQKSAKKKITKTEKNSAQSKYVSFDNKHYWASFVKDEDFSQEVRKSFFCKMAEFQQKKNAPHRRRNPEEIVLSEHPNLMKPEGAASQSAPSSEKASRKNTHIQREPTTSTRELTRRYPAKDFYLLPKSKKKNETWCNWGVTGDDHLPAVQCDGCGTWYHYEKNGEGMQHCDYTEGEETEEWYCVTCREEHQIFGEFDSTQLDDGHDKDKHHHPDNVHDNADGGFENLTHTGYDDPSLAQIGSSDNLEANFTTTVVLNVTEEELNYIPPKQSDVTFSAESISKIYNYDTEKFVQEKKARGDELAQRLRESGILCAFKNCRAPYYYATKKQDQSFAKKEGYCSCGMKFNLIFLSKPVQGFPVKAKFLLQQHYHGHISIITVTSALQSHQHLGQHPAKERFDCNGFEDLKQLDQHNKITHNPNGVIKGYIQDYNLDPKLFRVDLFDQQSLKLLADKIAKEHVTLGIDATGGILKPLSNAGRSAESSSQQNSKNQPRSARPRNSLLLYSFVAQTGSGNFVVADSILMRGQYGFWVLIFMSAMMAINLLIVIMINVKGGDNNRQNVNINRPKSAADMICTDLNFAMLHAVSESLNVMKLEEYLRRSYDALQDKATFLGDIACIQLCASHLTKSFLDNVRRETATSKYAKKIVDASVRGLAKLQERTCLDEVNLAMQDVSLDGYVEPDDGNSPDFDEEDVVATKLLREKSPYYHLFRKIRKNLVQDVEVEAGTNPYYSPSVLNIYEDTDAPFIGIFARGVVQKTKYPSFVRVTNRGTEFEFRLIKNNLIANSENVADFIRNRFIITNGKIKHSS
ncbi:Transcription factor BYE1 [Folsomia candida]|uniref:Transcription factor BYE1 n=1 Tax=Folsomia candida TaxID=158441 RepID=A0A226DZG3_FOLCA|nr:Transcription factor BYE1 [Folsomia candida]